jgi:hypothetical protein
LVDNGVIGGRTIVPSTDPVIQTRPEREPGQPLLASAPVPRTNIPHSDTSLRVRVDMLPYWYPMGALVASVCAHMPPLWMELCMRPVLYGRTHSHVGSVWTVLDPARRSGTGCAYTVAAFSEERLVPAAHHTSNWSPCFHTPVCAPGACCSGLREEGSVWMCGR